jgi:hypothetical protein
VLQLTNFTSSSVQQSAFNTRPTAPNPVTLSTAPDFAQQLQARLTPGIQPRGQIEMTYEVWQSVNPPLTTTQNAGFLRPDARLAFILLTNSGDWRALDRYKDYVPPYVTGSSLILDDAGDVIRALQEIKGAEHPEKISLGVLTALRFYVGEEDALRCKFWQTDQYVEPTTAPSIHVNPLLVVTNGMRSVLDESCPVTLGEYGELAERMSEAASGLRTHFELSSLADLAETIDVSVDGVTVPTSDSSGLVWSLESTPARPGLRPARDEVHFVVARAPLPGAKVVVRYKTRRP